jgi:hypothetical protein
MKTTQTISKTTVGIIVIMILITGSLLSFSYWYSWAGVIPAVASIGGMVVWVGLWIEKEADKDAKKEEHLSDSVKLKAKWGWNILMVGIGLEIVTGSALATFDVSEASKFHKDVNRIDPENLPILNMNALVKLRVKGNVFPDLTQWDSIPISTNWGSKTATATLCGNAPNSVLQSIPVMISDGFGIGTGYPDSRVYFLNFHMESVSAALALPMQPASKSFNDAKSISIQADFLPPQSEILDGYAFVVVNNGLWKLFRIYPQKDTRPPFPSKQQSEILAKVNIQPVEQIVVSNSSGLVGNLRMTVMQPGKVVSITNSEVFPVDGAGFFKSVVSIVGTNVPDAKFDENWRW